MNTIKSLLLVTSFLIFLSCNKNPQIACCFDSANIITFDFNLTNTNQQVGDTIGTWYSTYSNSSKELHLYSDDVNYLNINEGTGFVTLKKSLNELTFINLILIDLGRIKFFDYCTNDYEERKLGTKKTAIKHEPNSINLTFIEADNRFEQPKCPSHSTPLHKKTSYVRFSLNSNYDWEAKELVHGMTVTPSSGKAGDDQTITLSLKDNSENTSLENYRILVREKGADSNFFIIPLYQDFGELEPKDDVN